MATKICIFNPVSQLIDIIDGIDTFSGHLEDAGKPIVLNSQGQLDPSLTLPQMQVIAGTPLTAGQLVSIYYDTGSQQPYAKPASAAEATPLPANGFVTADTAAGSFVSVYFTGMVTIPYTSGFTASDIGTPVYLSTSTPGFIQKTRPVQPDYIQPVGYIYQVTATDVLIPFIAAPLTSQYNVDDFANISGICGIYQGGTGVNLNATGGTSQVLMQTTVGGNITVAQLASTDLSDAAALEYVANKGAADGYAPLDGSSLVPLANIPELPESQVTGLVADLAAKVVVAGDIGGTAASPKVIGLQGVAVSTTAPSDGMLLTYVAADTKWEPLAPAAVSSYLVNGNPVITAGPDVSVNGVSDFLVNGA